MKTRRFVVRIEELKKRFYKKFDTMWEKQSHWKIALSEPKEGFTWVRISGLGASEAYGQSYIQLPITSNSLVGLGVAIDEILLHHLS